MSKPVRKGMHSVAGISDTIPAVSAANESKTEADDQTIASLSQQDTIGSPAGSQKSSSESEDNKTADQDPQQPTAPVQKRRRVTRACDECRRKKIKCDGKHPCTHCTVYSYECTYDKPSNRRRNPAPQYIEALENRLLRAETLLRQYIPDLNLSDPDLDPVVQQEFRNRVLARKKLAATAEDDNHENATLASMVESVGTLNLDDHGGWDFHGSSSGAMFLQRMKENFQGMLGPAEQVPFLPRSDIDIETVATGFSEPKTPLDALCPKLVQLPSKELARSLCYYSLNCATCLIRIAHVPSFYDTFDAIYDKPIPKMTSEELHSLALLHAVLALGYMYRNLDPASGIKSGYEAAIKEGIKHYETAKLLLQDITDCRDLKTLQALLFLILFLQASSKLSTCYSFVGIALRSALRMGLHRDLEHKKMTPVEVEERRRVFYVIRQLDVYVSAMLGFPLLLQPDDIDQKYPSEVDDEYIGADKIMPQPEGTPSFFEAFNAHTRLMEIMAKILKFVYPIKGMGLGQKVTKAPSTYLVSYGKIREIEKDLQQWFEKLPAVWRPGSEGSIEMIRIQHLLRFAYAHVQLVLYRPFLHYVSPRLAQGKMVDEVSYACAAAAISVSRNLVHIGIEIRKQGVLIGPYWFMLYTEFFAVLSLVFYATENPNKNGTPEVLADACAGRDMVAKFAEQSMVADRVTKALKYLFDRLPERLANIQSEVIPNRKRSVPMRDDPRAGYAQADLSRSQTSSLYPFQAIRNLQSNPLVDPTFSSPNMAELLPVDLSTRATPESTGTADGSVVGRSYAASASGATIGRLNSLMFPSDDPFAYPTHPPMDMAFGHKPSGQASQDPSGYYVCQASGYDDLDPQLVNSMPGFMLQQATVTAHGHSRTSGGLNFSGNVYGQLSEIGSVDHSPVVQAAVPQRRTQGVPASVYPTQGFDGDWNMFDSSFPNL